MFDKASLIERKSLIVRDGSNETRQESIQQVRDAFLRKWPAGRVFTLSEHINSPERFLKSVRQEFPIKPKLADQQKHQMSSDQLNDSYLDWVDGEQHMLVIIPELFKLYRTHPSYFYEVLGRFLYRQHYLKGRVLRVLITLSEPCDISFNSIPVLMGGDWRPTANDLEII